MKHDNLTIDDTAAVLSQALDDALALFSETADVRPMVGMVALLDGIIDRCIALQPEATEQLLAIQHRRAKDVLLGAPSRVDDLEQSFQQASAMHLLTAAIEKRVHANA